MKKKQGAAIVWFRSDLRLEDHPALVAASEYEIVIPVFSLADVQLSDWPLGGATRWWLHHSLNSLTSALNQKKMPLFIFNETISEKLPTWVENQPIRAIFWNRRYEPEFVRRDAETKLLCQKLGIFVESFSANLLAEPWEILKSDKNTYQVYTAYWNAFLKSKKVREVVAVQPMECQIDNLIGSVSLESLNLLPKIPWDKGYATQWQPGEAHARRSLQEFLKNDVRSYNDARNLPEIKGTSRLSAHLHFGEISGPQIWAELRKKFGDLSKITNENITQYCKELIWRDFSAYLLFHFPHIDKEPLRPEFKNFPWRNKPSYLKAWQRGLTGYPLVDAGMRELWHTGWMHNRVRMITASFLVKDLLISWQDGAKWFWDTLVDADLANNTQGWQWTAGCGADAAPYFRIFNPTLQSEKFDTKGKYIRKWVPELARLENKWIHQPVEAPAEVLSAAGVVLGETYPEPIVEHAGAKIAALNALKKMKS